MTREYKQPRKQRVAANERQKVKRLRRDNGITYLQMECDENAVTTIADALGAPKTEAAVAAIHGMAMTDDIQRAASQRRGQRWLRDQIRHALANPTTDHFYVKADGSCVIKSDSSDDEMYLAPEEWTKWQVILKRGGYPMASGWAGDLKVTDNTRDVQIQRAMLRLMAWRDGHSDGHSKPMHEQFSGLGELDEFVQEAVQRLITMDDRLALDAVREFLAEHPNAEFTEDTEDWMVKWARARFAMQWYETMALLKLRR